MFNKEFREHAEYVLRESVDEYKETLDDVKVDVENLYDERKGLKTVLDQASSLINEFKNTPEKFNHQVKEIQVSMDRYQGILDTVNAEYNSDVAASAGVGAAGALAGVGVAALAPSAAMAIATTFGTASTGAAISTLGGAAATNAALAWLGGGALAAGGAGMAGGEALLALAGPIGWAIGGTALIGGGLLMNGKNKKAAEEMLGKAKKVKADTKVQKALSNEVMRMINLTQKDTEGVQCLYNRVDIYNRDYQAFSEDQRLNLGAFVNDVLASAKRLNMVIGENNKFVYQEG